jgi:UPF0755 protein
LKRKQTVLLVLGGIVLGGCFGVWSWMRRELAPTPFSDPEYYHLDRPRKLDSVLVELTRLGIVRDPNAMKILAWIQRRKETIRAGTYQIQGGLQPEEIFRAITSPIHRSFRFPETNWARRDANLLQKAEVCSARDYLSLVNDPSQFANTVDFALPSNTLEGYLYPDTYDLPPLTGAHAVIDRQLRDFDNKVVKRFGADQVTEPVICKASLVELETGTDEDRPMIAAVIENRLKKGIPLQIDAGIMYALGKWRRLFFKDYKEVKSPYNLYLHKGLPPTPICSPSAKSIAAVLNPAKNDNIYYVALPNGHSLFAKTPAQHEHNIKLRKRALLLLEKQKAQAAQMVGTTPSTTDKTTTTR